jgi:hypothetical protein
MYIKKTSFKLLDHANVAGVADVADADLSPSAALTTHLILVKLI